MKWILVFLVGCGAANTGTSAAIKLSKEECQSKALDIIAAGKDCLATEQQLNNLARSAPECVALLGGGDFGKDLCREQLKSTLERELPE